MLDPQHRYTLEEYGRLVEALPDHKYEYVDGEIRMMTGGSPSHGQIAARIAGMLDAALRQSDCNVYNSAVALRLMHDRRYYPDASVSCDPLDWTRTKAIEAPSVVIEVLSPSTEKIDRTEKLDAYQRYPTIQEILLVASRLRAVRHYHRMGSHVWNETLYEDEADVIDLACIGVSLSVRDIYFKVYLELEEPK